VFRLTYKIIIIFINIRIRETGIRSFQKLETMSEIFMQKKNNNKSCIRKTFDRFATKDSYTWNITHSTESTAV
jgi:hypothetical protein